jgi:hypothetical protein
MAYFVKINSNNVVEKVIAVNNNELLDNGIESEIKGIEYCKSLFGQDTNWLKTSYNTFEGKHYVNDHINGVILSQDQSKSFRKNYAGLGYTYDQQRDAFIPPKPFNSWILNEDTCRWVAPVSMPDKINSYLWNEETQSWDLDTLTNI